jgi:site-specific DNA-methyltransferase (adenine-specific)
MTNIVELKPSMRFECGDCLELMKSIPDKSVDLILSDVPYKCISGGTTSKLASGWKTSVLKYNDGKIFTNNNISPKEYLSILHSKLKDRSHCYIMINNIGLLEMLSEAKDAGFRFHNLLVWHKNTMTANRWYMKSTEIILFFYKGCAKPINNMGSHQVLKYDNPRNKVHPTEKPVKLFEHLIGNSSNSGDIVLDPFMGSGTTGVACKNLGREFIGFEKDPTYFEIAKKRIEETPCQTLLS